jgi:hypothetical protein
VIVKEMLRPVFKGRLFFRVPLANPLQRARLNAVNRRLRDANGKVGVRIDGSRAMKMADDFEQTMLLEGGTGEIDKRSDDTVSHLSDGAGYYIIKEFPVLGKPKAKSMAY